MMGRTLYLEVGVGPDASGKDWYWVQQRWSDGEVRPIGQCYASYDELLEDVESLLDGDPMKARAMAGLERAPVRVQSVPYSGRELMN